MLIRRCRCDRRYGSFALLKAFDFAHWPFDRWCTGIFPIFFLPLLSVLFLLTLPSQLLILTSKQFAESQLGISLIPYNRMQRYFTSIDLRSAMQDNVAFKLAFGATFALTGFAQL